MYMYIPYGMYVTVPKGPHNMVGGIIWIWRCVYWTQKYSDIRSTVDRADRISGKTLYVECLGAGWRKRAVVW